MTTIFERVSTALATLSPAIPYAMDVYETTTTLPDIFIAYHVIYSDARDHHDNAESLRGYLVQISTYSRADLVNLPNVDAAMRAAGFVKSTGRQIPKDSQSGHYGYAQDYFYLEDNL